MAAGVDPHVGQMGGALPHQPEPHLAGEHGAVLLHHEQVQHVALRRGVFHQMFVVMIAVVFAQVILRYFFGMPLAWSDELSRLLLVWVSFMGVTLVHYSDAGDPAVTFLVDKLPNAPREVVDAVLNVLLIVGFAAIFKASLEYTVTNHRFVSAVLHYPNSVKYAVVPLSMALMVIKSLERTVVDFKKLMKNG